MRFCGGLLVFLQLAALSYADLYMHFPPGSNDRNRERNENRNNGNRLFDSQNNNKGGYPWNGNRELAGTWDGYKFYTGSKVHVEWTNQHAGGPDGNTDAQIIMQYACTTSGSSDYTGVSGDPLAAYYATISANVGYPTNATLADSDPNSDSSNQYFQANFQSTGQNRDGTNRIPCPSTFNCQGNFGDPVLDGTRSSGNYANLTDAAIQFYQGMSVQGNTGTWIGLEFGQHEWFYYYRDMCLLRSRNKNLYTADQQLNGNSAVFTRQNPNGGRDGFECPEERDYYPWWNPSPWIDIAVFVSNPAQCSYYQTNSQNVAPRYYCLANASDLVANTQLPITKAGCEKINRQWVKFPSHNLPAPECRVLAYSRDNHLGNTVPVSQNSDGSYSVLSQALDSNPQFVAQRPVASSYDWLIPDSVVSNNADSNGCKMCVLRMRYNMSSWDYEQFNDKVGPFPLDGSNRRKTVWDFNLNCPANVNKGTFAETYNTNYPKWCQNFINETGDQDPGLFWVVTNRPYVQLTNDKTFPVMSIAMNTDQVARTFQDRSYTLKICKSPAPGTLIWNLNMRGRRGNIVQCYPAVETDFVPQTLTMGSNDALHVQFCGSDFNPNNNANDGEGWRFSTRMNMVNTWDKMHNIPSKITDNYGRARPLLGDANFAMLAAFLTINKTTNCYNFQGANDNDNAQNNNITNCGKLNPVPACVDLGVWYNLPTGTYYYVSTRNNNFSNRSTKGILTINAVMSSLSAGAIAGITLAVLFATGGVGAAGMFFYAKKHPTSRIAQILTNVRNAKLPSFPTTMYSAPTSTKPSI